MNTIFIIILIIPPVRADTEQVGRGLIGALIVEDENDSPVDRDAVLLINDWRLNRRNPNRLDKDFESRHDQMRVSSPSCSESAGDERDLLHPAYRCAVELAGTYPAVLHLA